MLSKLARKLAAYAAMAAVLVSSHAAGAPMDLSTRPMDPGSQAHPNIMFLMDDSGSMDFEVMLSTNDGALWYDTDASSFWNASGVPNFNSDGDARDNWYKFVYLFPNGSSDDTRKLPDGNHDHFAIPPTPAYAFMRSSDYNPLYYNPAITYTPWTPAYIGSSTVTFPNATATAARSHPYFPTSGTAVTMDLTSTITSTNANWTFKMLPGMVIPGTLLSGVTARKNGSGLFAPVLTDFTIPKGEWWEVSVPYLPATYYMKDATCTSGSSCFKGPDGKALRRYQIKSGVTFPSGRTWDKELDNFANWFTYYRKRKLMLAASMGSVLPQIRNIYGGLIKFNARSPVTMVDFNGSTDSTNHRSILGLVYTNPSDGGTPTRDVLDYSGRQYMRTDANAPIRYACQRNAALVMTDGFANASSSVRLPSYQTSTWGPAAPYTKIYSNTLADIALYYYSGSDAGSLRTDIDPTNTTGQVGIDPADTRPAADKNTHLHLNVYGLTLNAIGTIWGTSSASVKDPYGRPPTWPNPKEDRSPTAVDDLWHAAINGRGQMYTASDSDTTTLSIRSMVSDMIDKSGAGSAVAVSNVNMRIGDNTAFASTYEGGAWTGDLRAYAVDITTGKVATGTTLWSAQALLDNLAPASRMIATYDPSARAGIPFQWDKLTATQQNQLSTIASAPKLTKGKDTLEFLRGKRSPQEADGYRVREHILGDIVNAEPVPVRAAVAHYADSGYSVFAAGLENRRAMVYQAANDGMLHALEAATGKELWAYVPSFLFPTLSELASPVYDHLPYVDATPAVGDVFMTSGGSGPSGWRTILTGGLRRGGMGYYALDITTPDDVTSESILASKVLWEFPNSSTAAADAQNVGYSYAKPIIAKTKAFGWVVIVTSGYNATAGNGKGYVFVLNPKTGAVLARVATADGTAANPVNLSPVAAWSENSQNDATVDTLYGGDNLGNVWRFDIGDSDSSKWKVHKLASLVVGTTPQPITSAPELTLIQNQRVIMIGTGRLLADSDMSTKGLQSMYALVDKGQTPPTLITRATLTSKLMTEASGGVRNVPPTPNFDWVNSKGWFIDLPAGERVSGDPLIAYGTVVFTTNMPAPVACTSGSYLYAINIATAGQQSASAFATGETPWTGKYLGGTYSSRPVVVVLPSGEIYSLTQGGSGKIDSSRLPLSWSRQVKKWGWREVIR